MSLVSGQFSNLLEEYEASYTEWNDTTTTENHEIQELVVAQFQERETPEDREEQAAKTKDEIEEERVRYEQMFEELRTLKKDQHSAKDDAVGRYGKLKEKADSHEAEAEIQRKAFEVLQREAASASRFRTGASIDEKAFENVLQTVANKISEWREENIEGILVGYKKLRTQEKLHQTRLAAGKDDTLLLFEELKADLEDYQLRLNQQDQDLQGLFEKERDAINELTHMGEKADYLGSLAEDLTDQLNEANKVLNANKKAMYHAHFRRHTARKQQNHLLESSQFIIKPKLMDDFEAKLRLRNRFVAENVLAKEHYLRLVGKRNVVGNHADSKPELSLLPKDYSDPATAEFICPIRADVKVHTASAATIMISNCEITGKTS